MSVFFKSSQKRLDGIKQLQAEKRRNVESNVVSTVARGSISLQRGEYITRDDMDKLQNELTGFFGSDESKW